MNRLRREGFSAFTADTGGHLSWQVGMEDPAFLGFLGIGEKGKREDTLKAARLQFPAPKSCREAEIGLPALRERIEYHKNDGTKKVGPRWVEALNTILQEHMAYISANCLGGAPTNTGIVPPGTVPAESLPVNAQSPADPQPTAAAGSIKEMVKKVPKWAWLAGGVLVLGTATLLIVKSK